MDSLRKLTVTARLRRRARWLGALAAWHALLFREELRHSPYRTFTVLMLAATLFVYAPGVAWAVEEMLRLAGDEGFDPADASVLPLTYAVFLTWMLGASLKGRSLWWVIRTAPVPRALLGLDRALGVFALAVVMAGPYVWGAVRGVGWPPAALVSLIAVPLWLSARVRGAGWLGYPFALLVTAAVGWSLAFAAARYLGQGPILYDPDHEMARELLRPVLARLHLPDLAAAALRAPAALHFAAGLLAFWGLGLALGSREDRVEGGGRPAAWLARWRDAPAAFALAQLVYRLDVGLLQAVLALAFALGAEAYGLARVPGGMLAWWAMASLWWSVWKEPPEFPGWLGAGSEEDGRVVGVLLAGRLRALALTLLPLVFVPGLGGVGMAVWVGAVWWLQGVAGPLARLRPAGLAGALVFLLGNAVLWIGGR